MVAGRAVVTRAPEESKAVPDPRRRSAVQGGESHAGGDGKEPEGIRKARAGLEAEGWHVVPAAGNLGPWDLVALHPCYGTRVVCVVDRAPSKTEMRRLKKFRCHPWWGRHVLVYPERAQQSHSPRLARRGGIAIRNAKER